MHDEEHFHRRHLPHLYLPNAVYFTTFRLSGSLPRLAVEQLREKSLLQKKSWIGFVDYDRALEKTDPKVCWLANELIANSVAESIRLRDGKEYDLAAYCIMPNHVHMVIGLGRHELFMPVGQTEGRVDEPIRQVGQIGNLSNKPVSKIMQSLKRYTASTANGILHRSGPFWQDESYDHVVRTETEFERVINYVVYNPVKAGLVKEWRDWKWTYSAFGVD